MSGRHFSQIALSVLVPLLTVGVLLTEHRPLGTPIGMLLITLGFIPFLVILTVGIRDIANQFRVIKGLAESEKLFRLLVSEVQDYAIFALNAEGIVVSWNIGAQRINGYRAEEVLGRHFSLLFPPEDVEKGKPEMELKNAADFGRFAEEGWTSRLNRPKIWH